MSVVIKIYQTLNNNGLTENLSKIDMSDEKDYILFFDNEGKKVHLGNDSDLSTKIVCLKGMLEVLPGKTGELCTIEIRPRENQITGRLGILAVKKVLEQGFIGLDKMASNSDIYRIGMKGKLKQKKVEPINDEER